MGCTIQSTIRDSAHSNSNEQVIAMSDSEEPVYTISDSKELADPVSDSKSDPSRDPKVATHTTNGYFAKKILKNRFVPKIIQGKICLIEQLVMEDVPGVRETLGAWKTVISKEIVTDAVRSGVRIFALLGRVATWAGMAPLHRTTTPP